MPNSIFLLSLKLCFASNKLWIIRSNRRNNFDKQTATKAYDHYDFNRQVFYFWDLFEDKPPISSVMQYGEFAFRDKEWGDLSAQFTRFSISKVFPADVTWHIFNEQFFRTLAVPSRNYWVSVKPNEQ